MLCPGCGKRIPFVGEVCPYCQRNKSKAQGLYLITLAITGVIAAIGYGVYHWPGLIGGAVAGWIGGHAWMAYKSPAPPEVIPRK